MWTLKETEPSSAVFCRDTDALRIEAVRGACLRITHTQGKAFLLRQEPMLVRPETDQTITVSDEGAVYRLQADAIGVLVDKQSGGLRYIDLNGQTLTREPEGGGRTLRETDIIRYRFESDGPSALRQSADGVKATAEGAPYMDRQGFSAILSFLMQEDEALYGLGQHEERVLNHRLDTQYLYQHNLKISCPVLLSSRGYGIFLNSAAYILYEGHEAGCDFTIDAADELDYFVFHGGNLDGCIAIMRDLTGDAPMPPKWAFGYLQSKERYQTQQELIDIAAEYRRRQIPLDAVVQDWHTWPDGQWGQKSVDTKRYQDLQAATDALHAMHCRLMWSIWPNMTGNGADRLAFAARGLLLGNQSTYDALSKEARALYWKQANENLFQNGIDSWWCDCTEPFEADWMGEEEPSAIRRMQVNVAEGKRYLDPVIMNAYSLYHSQGIYEGQRETGDDKRVLILTRSGYPGQQRYGTFVWNGDTSANWRTLADSIPNALNLCATGIPYWTQDVGAFFVKRWQQWFGRGEYENGVDDEAYRELYLRWFQVSTFLPMLRAHGTDTPRELWRFGTPGEVYYDGLLSMIHLRMRLLPYLYSLAADIHFYRGTMLRMLAFDFPDDSTARECMDQFMLGRALLVCPVLIEGARTRQVYLPKGAGWYSFETGQYYPGGQWITVEAPLAGIPLFVKEGSILPLGPVRQYCDEPTDQPLTLRVYAGADADFALYDDAGDGYGYEQGEYGILRLHWDEKDQRLTQTPEGDSRYIEPNRVVEIVAAP